MREKTLTALLESRITSMHQVKKTARAIRAKVRAVVAKYTVPVEFVMDIEAALK